MFCLKIMHWVHHETGIQDDLRKSSVFLFKNNTDVATPKHLNNHLCIVDIVISNVFNLN